MGRSLLRLSALKPVHGDNANANASENCGCCFQSGLHAGWNYEELIENEKSGFELKAG
jgi:hypothetical protein